MRVLVTGGSGFIGTKLVRALAERGDEVIVTSRDPERTSRELAELPEGHARAVKWSGERADDIAPELELADAVVHLAGASVADARWTPARLDLLMKSRTGPTSALARAIASASRKPRVLVSGSAVGYYGMRKDDAQLDEASPPGDDELAKICVAWEKSTEAARSAGVRVALARIGVVLGKDGGALPKMLAPFKLFVGGPLGDGKQWVSWIHWRDVVGALVFAIDQASLQGPFDVTAPAPVTMGDLARAIGRALGRPSVLRVPAFALKLAVGDGMARVVLTGQRALPKKLEECGYRFHFGDIDAALADLVGARP